MTAFQWDDVTPNPFPLSLFGHLWHKLGPFIDKSCLLSPEISYLSFFQAQTLSVWPLFVSCDIKFISATNPLLGRIQNIAESREFYSAEIILFLPLSGPLLVLQQVWSILSFSICGHPGGEVFVSRPMTGVVRVSISVIKILTERDRGPLGWLEGVKFRFLHIHDVRL